MNIDYQLLSRLIPLTGIKDENIIACMKIHKYNKSNKNKVALLLTEYKLLVLEKITHDADLEVVMELPWNQVTHLKIAQDSTFYVESYDTSTGFDINGLDRNYSVYNIVSELITHIYETTGHRVPFTGIEKKLVLREPSNLTIIKRIKFNAFIKDLTVPLDFINSIENELRKEKNTLDLNDIKGIEKYAKDVLMLLDLVPNIDTLVMPKNILNWNDMSEFVLNNFTIKDLTLSIPVTGQFSKLSEAFRKASLSRVVNITFSNSQFTLDNCHYIRDLLLVKKFRKVVFKNCFASDYTTEIISSFFKEGSTLPVDNIEFNDVSNLPSDLVIQGFSNIKSLSIVKCNTDLWKVLLYMDKSSLTTIIIDGGFANSNCFKERKQFFPHNMRHITFRNIRWDDNSFLFCWYRILDHEQSCNDGIYFDLSHANSSKSWDNLFNQYCIGQHSNIKEIVWDGNKIHENFISFLNNCTRLEVLSLNECFSLQYRSYIPIFAQMISRNKTIKRLYIRGSDSCTLDSHFNTLYEGIASNNSIQYLDISVHKISDKTLLKLGDCLIKNKSLDTVLFDDTSVKEKDKTYRSFFEKFSTRPIPNLQWPYKDMMRLRSIHGLDKHYINLLRLKYVRAIGEERDYLYPPEYEPNEVCVDVLIGSLVQGSEWNITLPTIPEPDNKPILDNALKQFSLQALL